MLGWLSASLGMAVLSSVIPPVLIEPWVLGVAVTQPYIPWWALALVTAVGSVAGKLVYFYAGKGMLRLPSFLRRKQKDAEHVQGRWSGYMERFAIECEKRPTWTYGVLLLSSSTSLPPYFAVAVVAGVANVSLTNFVSACLIGRFVRFAALAAMPSVFGVWLT